MRFRDVLAAVSVSILLAACSGGSHPVTPIPQSQNDLSDDAIVSNGSQSSPATGDDWPTFAHDQERQSYETLQTAVTQQTVKNLTALWTYPASGVRPTAGFEASPIVVNGVVYVVDTSGVVSALDAATGVAKWHYTIPDSAETKMTPALYDGILFVSSFQTKPTDDKYYVVALNPSTGQQLWTQTLPGGVHGSPVSVNGTLYLPVSDGDEPYCRAGGVYALNEKTGAVVGSPWLTDPPASSPDGGGVWSSLTYDGDQLYYGTGNTCTRSPATANAIIASTPGVTTANWHISTANPLTDDDVGGSTYRGGHTALVIGKNGVVYRINALTGQIVWSRSLGAPDGAGAFATPTYFGSGTDATIIVGGGYIKNPDDTDGAAGGRLYGLTIDGVVRWLDTTQSPVLGYVAVTRDLAFTELDTNVDALNPLTGAVLWSAPSVGYFYASPVIVPSGLFAADESGRVYAYGIVSKPADRRKIYASALSAAQIRQLQLSTPPKPPKKPAYCKIRA